MILGSATAAGEAVANPRRAWARHSQYEFTRFDTRRRVYNLGRERFNVWALLPTGDAVPPGIMIDTARNLTAALDLQPEVLIVNVPDAASTSDTAITLQLAAYARIMQQAEAEGVKIYLASPQPRVVDADEIARQVAMRDSMLSRFGAARITDVWTRLATAEGSMRPEFDFGDGVQVNDDGHREISRQVLAQALENDLSCRPPSSIFEPRAFAKTLNVSLAPNPSSGDAVRTIVLPEAAELELELVGWVGARAG